MLFRIFEDFFYLRKRHCPQTFDNYILDTSAFIHTNCFSLYFAIKIKF